jgi:hypothetical protein
LNYFWAIIMNMSDLFKKTSAAEVKQVKKSVFSERHLLPVVTADRLTVSFKHEKLLADIRKLIIISDKNYQNLYQEMINNFAEFVQLLPTGQQDRIGGLLEEGLRRGLFFLEAEDLTSGSFSSAEIYMLFSVALLFDVAKVIEERSIILSKKNGAFVGIWIPSCTGNMLNQAKYYRVRLTGGYSPHLCRRITPLLASKLLSERGFKLISKDPKLFYTWWALLSGEETENAAYRRMLNRAHEKLHDFVERDEYSLQVDIEPIESELQVGDDFMEWLKDYVANTDIATDENIEVLDNDRIFVKEEAFKEFAEEKQIANWEYVVEEVEELGYTEKSEEDRSLTEKISTEKHGADAKLFADKASEIKQTTAQQAINTDRGAKLGTSVGSKEIKNGVVISAAVTAQLMANINQASQAGLHTGMSHSVTLF